MYSGPAPRNLIFSVLLHGAAIAAVVNLSPAVEAPGGGARENARPTEIRINGKLYYVAKLEGSQSAPPAPQPSSGTAGRSGGIVAPRAAAAGRPPLPVASPDAGTPIDPVGSLSSAANGTATVAQAPANSSANPPAAANPLQPNPASPANPAPPMNPAPPANAAAAANAAATANPAPTTNPAPPSNPTPAPTAEKIRALQQQARAFVPPEVRPNVSATQTLIQPLSPPDLVPLPMALPNFRVFTDLKQMRKIPKPFQAPGRRTPPTPAQAPNLAAPALNLVPLPPAPVGDPLTVLSMNDHPIPFSEKVVVPAGNAAQAPSGSTGPTGGSGSAPGATAAGNAGTGPAPAAGNRAATAGGTSAAGTAPIGPAGHASRGGATAGATGAAPNAGSAAGPRSGNGTTAGATGSGISNGATAGANGPTNSTGTTAGATGSGISNGVTAGATGPGISNGATAGASPSGRGRGAVGMGTGSALVGGSPDGNPLVIVGGNGAAKGTLGTGAGLTGSGPGSSASAPSVAGPGSGTPSSGAGAAADPGAASATVAGIAPAAASASGAATSPANAGGSIAARNTPGSLTINRPPAGTFDAVVVQSSPVDQYPESRGLLSGRPIYSVYVAMGTARDWTLFFCVPGEKPASGNGPVVHLAPLGAPVKAPYPTKLLKPEISLPSYEKYVLVHGMVNKDGKFESLHLVRPIRPETDQALLAALASWEFRAATRDGVAIAVEFLLSIPAKGL